MKQFITLIVLLVTSLSIAQSMPVIPTHKSIKPAKTKIKTTLAKTKIVYVDRPVVIEKKESNEDKKRNCSQCNGTGYYTTSVQCIRCNASGMMQKKCDKCRGEGTIDCSKCHGTGKNTTAVMLNTALTLAGGTPSSDNETCSTCGGAGKIECNVCEGTGKVDQTCSSCNGSGIVTNKVRCTLHD